MQEIKRFPKLKRSDTFIFREGTRQIIKTISKLDGTLGFVCPSCKTDAYYRDAKVSLEDSGTGCVRVLPEFTMWCINCGYSYSTRNYYTPNITQAVSTLNKKGYTVISAYEVTDSIEVDTVDETPMSVVFPKVYKSTITSHAPNTPWYVGADSDSNMCSIRCSASVPIDEAIASLMEWVDLLPVYHKISFKTKIDSIDV